MEHRTSSARFPRRAVWLIGGLLVVVAALFAGRAAARWWVYRAARHALDRWAIATAQDWLQRAQSLDPTSGHSELMQARCYRVLGLFDQWEQVLQAAQQKQGRPDGVQTERVMRAIATGQVPPDVGAVREDFLAAGYSLDDISGALVTGYMAGSNWDQAEQQLRRWESATGAPSAHAAYMRGCYWLRRQQNALAVEQLNEALAREPDHQLARTLLAVLYDEQDQPEQALTQYVELVRRYPNTETYQIGLAAVLRKLTRLEAARRILEPLVEQESPDPDAMLQMAQVALDAGEYDTADRWFAGVDLDQVRDVGTLGTATMLYGLGGDTIRALELARLGDALEASKRRGQDVQTREILNPLDRSARQELAQLAQQPELGLRLGTLIPSEPTRQDVTVDGGESGAALYALHCTICHGATGGGDGRAGQHLYPAPRDFRRERFQLVSTSNGVARLDDIKQVVRQGIPGSSMPAYETLTDDQLTRTAEHVWQLYRDGLRDQFRQRLLQLDGEVDEEELEECVDGRTRPGTPIAVPDFPPATPASLSRGKRLYQDQGCAQCHGDDGRGALDVPLFDEGDRPLRPRDLAREPLKGGSEPPAVYQRLAVGMPGTPHPAAASLSEPQLIDLVHYVRSLAKPLPLDLTNHQRSIYAAVPAYREAFPD